MGEVLRDIEDTPPLYVKETNGNASKARLRMQPAQISTLYAGQSLMLAGRCPACRAEIVVTLALQ